MGAFLIENTKVALGVAILENAREEIAEIAAIEPEQLLDQEPRLLERARGLMPSLPLNCIDVLIVGELGKNYSGTGLDPNVIGRQRVETMPDLPRPLVTRLAVLDLSPESEGNALGIGARRSCRPRGSPPPRTRRPARVNCFTSNFLTRARMPLALPTDREVFRACIDTCWKIRYNEVSLVIIPNTLELTELWMSKPAAETAIAPLERSGSYTEIPFSGSGSLDQELLFPRSVRGRRKREKAGAV